MYDWGSTTGSALNIILTSDDQPDNYFIYDDPDINDILVVAADPLIGDVNEGVAPSCDIPGYDCACEEVSPIDPFTRKPVPEYTGGGWFGRDNAGFIAYKTGLGWTENGYLPIPDGYFGFWILLNQWSVFGYEDFEEWNFGVVFRQTYDKILDIEVDLPYEFDFDAAVEYIDEPDGNYIYEWVIKIPDQDATLETISVGDCFKPIYYDATYEYSTEMDSQMVLDEFCIGEPWHE